MSGLGIERETKDDFFGETIAFENKPKRAKILTSLSGSTAVFDYGRLWMAFFDGKLFLKQATSTAAQQLYSGWAGKNGGNAFREGDK